MGRAKACIPFDYDKFIAIMRERGLNERYIAVDFGHKSDYWEDVRRHQKLQDGDRLLSALTRKTAVQLEETYGITPDMYAPDQPKDPERVPEQMTLEIAPDPQDLRTVLADNVRALNLVTDLLNEFNLLKTLLKEMQSMNKVTLIGRLCADPEVRRTTSGKTVARFRLAVDRRGKGEEKAADFIQCVAWEKSAELVEKYLKKGTKIAVSGRIQTD